MKREGIPFMAPADLETLSTRQLLARLKRLQQCAISIELSDKDENDFYESGLIEFKNTSEWTQAYHQLKDVLAGREHVAKGLELVERRRQKALRNKTAERMFGKNNQ